MHCFIFSPPLPPPPLTHHFHLFNMLIEELVLFPAYYISRPCVNIICHKKSLAIIVLNKGERCSYVLSGLLISPYPDQEGNKLQWQKILSFIYPIYNHNWRNISTIYIYNKTSIKRNILTIKQNTSGSRSG